MTSQLSLIDLDHYHSESGPSYTPDPFWDEIVLDSSGSIEPEGQATLFYDDSYEPPDPDDYQDLKDYYQAWRNWEKRYPEDALQIRRDRKYKPGDKVRLLDKNCMTYGSIAVVIEHRPGFPVNIDCFVRRAFYPRDLEPYSDKYGHHDKTIEAREFIDYSILTKIKSYEQVKLPEIKPLKPPYEHPSNAPKSIRDSGWIEQYYVKRCEKKHYYYRYCWTNGKRTNYLHLGPSGSEKVMPIVEDVRRMTKSCSSEQILNHLRTVGIKKKC
jgi:hypothetical protein